MKIKKPQQRVSRDELRVHFLLWLTVFFYFGRFVFSSFPFFFFFFLAGYLIARSTCVSSSTKCPRGCTGDRTSTCSMRWVSFSLDPPFGCFLLVLPVFFYRVLPGVTEMALITALSFSMESKRTSLCTRFHSFFSHVRRFNWVNSKQDSVKPGTAHEKLGKTR